MSPTTNTCSSSLAPHGYLFHTRTHAKPVLTSSRRRGGSLGPACSFGPHTSRAHPGGREAYGAHGPHAPKAVRLGTPQTSENCALELQQRKLRIMFEAPPAADVELSSTAAQALEEVLHHEQRLVGQANAIVPRPGLGTAFGVTPKQLAQRDPEPLGEPASPPPSSAEQNGAATGQGEPAGAAPRRRGRPRRSGADHDSALGEDMQQLLAESSTSSGQPSAGLDELLATVRRLAAEADQLSASLGTPQQRRQPRPRRQQQQQQEVAGSMAASPAPATKRQPRRQGAMSKAAPALAAASHPGGVAAGQKRRRSRRPLDSISAAAEQGPGSQPAEAPAPDGHPAAAGSAQQQQGPAQQNAAALQSVESQQQQPAAVAPAPAGVVCSTRAASSGRSRPSSGNTRRVRLTVQHPSRVRGASLGSVSGAAGGPQGQPAAQQGQQAAPQQTEGERDALFLERMRDTLQRGRRKKRHTSLPGASSSGSVSMFLGMLGDTPILSKEQEMRLARVLQKGRRLQVKAAALLEALGREPSHAELAAHTKLPEAEVSLRLSNQQEAKDLLLQYNLRLVVHIAKRYANQGVELSELISEGEMGLRKSIERYDPERGFRFSTYAHWYIRQPISRAVAEQGRDVRLPVHICEMLTKIHRCEQDLNKDPSRVEPATREEVARALGMPLPRLLHFLRLARAPRVVAEGGRDTGSEGSGLMTTSMKDINMEEQWEDDDFNETMNDINTLEHVKKNVSVILSTLPKRERNILRMRYGLLQADADEADPVTSAYPYPQPAPPPMPLPAGAEAALATELVAARPGRLQQHLLHEAGVAASSGGAGGSSQPQELSLTDVSLAYGLSKERIRQLEDRALRSLRKPWRVRLLEEINSGNRLSANTLAHLEAAMRPGAQRRGERGAVAEVAGAASLQEAAFYYN
ncbi:hypothetical protein N2152v2_005336 [Parachlorella kessleri]